MEISFVKSFTEKAGVMRVSGSRPPILPGGVWISACPWALTAIGAWTPVALANIFCGEVIQQYRTGYSYQACSPGRIPELSWDPETPVADVMRYHGGGLMGSGGLVRVANSLDNVLAQTPPSTC